ncbi:hypothetical protein TNCV_3151321 [Trichonephila clavipes]|nr:hypothetical protein TNCV_3151321 [Trichonephila clavipes]
MENDYKSQKIFLRKCGKENKLNRLRRPYETNRRCSVKIMLLPLEMWAQGSFFLPSQLHSHDSLFPTGKSVISSMPTSSFNGVVPRSNCVGSRHVERLTTGRLPKHSVRSSA